MYGLSGHLRPIATQGGNETVNAIISIEKGKGNSFCLLLITPAIQITDEKRSPFKKEPCQIMESNLTGIIFFQEKATII